MDQIFSFGAWVRRRRRALDLKQDELAQQVGCAVSMIKKIEADVRRPSRQLAERLAASLAIVPAERDIFLQAARAELAVDRLDLAVPPSGAPVASARQPRGAGGAQPTDTIAFLFTDIAGSTQLWEQHPQAMPIVLARHDTLLRAAVAAHGGNVFKTAGDSVCAAFPTGPAALAAALEAQRALHGEPWGPTGPLRVRMALHTGTAEARESDYFGPALNRAARLLAAAHGDQILLSRATRELAADRLPADVQLRDLGRHRLKDLSQPEQVFQLVVPDLPADFPALRTRD